jgi:hypothetical protein
MNLNKIQWAGIWIVVLSLAVGIIGMAWGIYSSFEALNTAESRGIGPVGDGIRNSLFFSAGGLTALLAGVILLIFGKSRPKK